MPALIAAQAFAQRPVDDRQFAGAVVIEKVAGMGIAVKNGLFLRR